MHRSQKAMRDRDARPAIAASIAWLELDTVILCRGNMSADPASWYHLGQSR